MKMDVVKNLYFKGLLSFFFIIGVGIEVSVFGKMPLGRPQSS